MGKNKGLEWGVAGWFRGALPPVGRGVKNWTNCTFKMRQNAEKNCEFADNSKLANDPTLMVANRCELPTGLLSSFITGVQRFVQGSCLSVLQMWAQVRAKLMEGCWPEAHAFVRQRLTQRCWAVTPACWPEAPA
eukprot:1158409-Pelagomonas_calceolata.AAC.2